MAKRNKQEDIYAQGLFSIFTAGKSIFYEVKSDSSKVAKVKLYTKNYQGRIPRHSPQSVSLRTLPCNNLNSAYLELKQKAQIKNYNAVINAFAQKISCGLWIAFGEAVNI